MFFSLVIVVSSASSSLSYEGTSGQALYRACSGVSPQICLSYVAGIIDFHEVPFQQIDSRLFCPQEVDPEMVGRGIWLYFDQNPETLEQPAILGALHALTLMFPCE
tara:strand:- start:93 stop:410 length:318 start_codon:yes stop_codon:yes gene_type:complete